MPNSGVHVPQGLAISGIALKSLAPILTPLGLDWSLPIFIAVVGYFAHMALDCVPHADTVVYGTKEDFRKSMTWDPKEANKHVGLWPVFSWGSREAVRKIDPQVADPPPVSLTPWPMFLAYLDVITACLFTIACLVPYVDQQFSLLCLATGAFFTVAPDLVLAKPIHDRAINNDLFWRLEYLHHWCHAPVMLRQDRVAGTIVQIVLFTMFCWLAWTFRP